MDREQDVFIHLSPLGEDASEGHFFSRKGRRCKICKRPAYIDLPQHNISLCAEHFDGFFVQQVERTIRRYRMLPPRAKVVVALSGGKDSLVTALVLKRLGYEVLGFHVDLGIDLNDYSPKSREAVLTFSRRFEIPVEIVSLKEAYDKTIPDVYKREKKICPICGMTRRHLMNAYALKAAEVYGAYALATGHHLDDLTAQLFANVLRWDFHYLAKGLPVLPPEDGFARKIKPLALTSEFEVVAFARLHNVEFVRCSCPLGKDAKFRKYQSMLRAIEALSPGTKRYFYQRYTEIAHIFAEQAPEARPALRKCLVCGMPSSSPVCSFCRIWRPEEAEAALRQYRGFTLSPASGERGASAGEPQSRVASGGPPGVPEDVSR
ncbi:MAG: tRNA(U54)-2-thioribothymidine synthetase [Brockia lithotrophica]|uniref:tRNA(U54)-2-thioribothymidine synthetase n=1 Tax=Brockia lithotrophica TaxID=933949 RepID=A0A2T5G5Y6_9BACL|nr:MAG: tRNA(U54)-2-thioribothymidine synthetase [Brockia lithotrophica]